MCCSASFFNNQSLLIDILLVGGEYCNNNKQSFHYCNKLKSSYCMCWFVWMWLNSEFMTIPLHKVLKTFDDRV